MTAYVEWVDPFDREAKYAVIFRMTVSDVIAYQHGRDDHREKGYVYESDADALDDFVVTHWASIIEVDDGPTD